MLTLTSSAAQFAQAHIAAPLGSGRETPEKVGLLGVPGQPALVFTEGRRGVFDLVALRQQVFLHGGQGLASVRKENHFASEAVPAPVSRRLREGIRKAEALQARRRKAGRNVQLEQLRMSPLAAQR